MSSAACRCASFSRAPRPGGAHLRRHAQHVRPLRRPAVLDRGHRVDEPAHRAAIVEGAEQDAAALDRDDQDRRRDDILGIGVAPDGLFEGGHLAAFVERGERSDLHQRSAGNSRSDLDDRHVVRTAVGVGARHRSARRAPRACRGRARPRCRPAGCRRPSPPRAAATADLSQRRLEDAAVRLHVAVVEGRDRGRKEPFEREVALKCRQGSLRCSR